MPPVNQYLLLYTLDLLSVFARKSDVNLMTAPSKLRLHVGRWAGKVQRKLNCADLSLIFQPGVLSHPQHAMRPREHVLSQQVLEFLIEHQDNFLIGMQLASLVFAELTCRYADQTRSPSERRGRSARPQARPSRRRHPSRSSTQMPSRHWSKKEIRRPSQNLNPSLNLNHPSRRASRPTRTTCYHLTRTMTHQRAGTTSSKGLPAPNQPVRKCRLYPLRNPLGPDRPSPSNLRCCPRSLSGHLRKRSSRIWKHPTRTTSRLLAATRCARRTGRATGTDCSAEVWGKEGEE